MNITAIVTTYNSKETIITTLKSICKYNFNEVLVIDDKSRDNTVELIKKEFSHVKIFEKRKNTGLSDSRNIGIEIAKSDYIFFMDSDDTLTYDITKIDIFKPITRFASGVYDFKKNKVIKSDRPMFKFKNISARNYFYNYQISSYIFSRSFLNKNNIRFGVGLFAEDFDLIHRYFNVMYGNYTYINKSIYNYTINRSGSIMQEARDSISAYEKVSRRFEKTVIHTLNSILDNEKKWTNSFAALNLYFDQKIYKRFPDTRDIVVRILKKNGNSVGSSRLTFYYRLFKFYILKK